MKDQLCFRFPHPYEGQDGVLLSSAVPAINIVLVAARDVPPASKILAVLSHHYSFEKGRSQSALLEVFYYL